MGFFERQESLVDFLIHWEFAGIVPSLRKNTMGVLVACANPTVTSFEVLK